MPSSISNFNPTSPPVGLFFPFRNDGFNNFFLIWYVYFVLDFDEATEQNRKTNIVNLRIFVTESRRKVI